MTLEMTKYLGLFVSEAGDHLAKLGAELVRLEGAARDGADTQPIVDGLFRHAHSVKGMSASMQLEGIAALAHHTEDLVDVFRRRAAVPDAGSVDALLAAVDALTAMIDCASRGESPDPEPALVERLAAQAERARAEAEHPERPVSAPAAERELAKPPEPASASTPAAHRRVAVEVEVAASCPVPSVRAFLVVKKLARIGAVARASPPVQDLKAGRLPGRKLEVVIETAEPLSEVERALGQISDLGSVTVREDRPEAAPPPTAPAPREEHTAGAEAGRTVRVRVELLDSFLDVVGELILATARLREIGRAIPEPFRPPLEEGVDRLHGTVKDLHDKVMAVRMTPLAVVTDRLPRAARDLARRIGKQVDVEVRGADIEIDRAILDELSDPLLHVLRNAVDHGIEAPHLRLLARKPATGHITVTARRDRDRVLLEIADDGKGMDPEKLRASAVAKGAMSEAAARALGDHEALLLACLPGVSTADEVTELSGRGVGMDAVKRTADTLGGTLDVESVGGGGTRWILRLPLTVAVQPVLLLGFTTAAGTAPRSVVVAEGDGGRVGLAVDALLGQQDAVLKPLARPLDLVPGLSAVTVLGNGRPVFILDVQRLLAA